jgi:hypothetical protein
MFCKLYYTDVVNIIKFQELKDGVIGVKGIGNDYVN